jgi:hypothetical protein
MKGELIKVENGYVLMVNNIMYATDNDKLSKKNCDEIFGIVDIDKLVQDYMEQFKNPMLKNYRIGEAFNDGFKKAMELNKDKLFTVEDIMKAFEAGYETLESEKTYNEHYDILIQSLQQPKEIEVEIDMWFHGTRHEKGKWIERLDKNGCLILKKK